MTGQPFGPAYASLYDEFYADKDYEGEVELAVAAFRRYARGEIRSVLDVGCGTGGHALPLIERGFDVTGIDVSEEMIDLARSKAAAAGVELDLRVADARTFDLGRTFDAALLLFAVLGYMQDVADVLSALRAVRRHLRPGGLLYLDAWYGPHVLAHPPQDAERTVVHDGVETRRNGHVEIDTAAHLCTVHYRIEGSLADEETHVVRFFFLDELDRFLTTSGFKRLSFTGFGSLDEPPGDDTRTFIAVAEAV